MLALNIINYLATQKVNRLGSNECVLLVYIAQNTEVMYVQETSALMDRYMGRICRRQCNATYLLGT